VKKAILCYALLLTGCTKEVDVLVAPSFESELWLSSELVKFEPSYPGNFRNGENTLFMYTVHGVIFLRPGEPPHDMNETIKYVNAELDRVDLSIERLGSLISTVRALLLAQSDIGE
jgi:hypothetical protein